MTILEDKIKVIKSLKPKLGLKDKMEYLKKLRKKRFDKRKKIKKVIKGLQKASKTHAAQAKTLKGVLRKNATRNNNN